MKKIKRILLATLVLVLAVTFTACKKSEKRNTIVPYGSINLNEKVAWSDKGIELKNDYFYSRLRAKGYDLVLENIKKVVYKNEISAINALLNSTTYAELDSNSKLAFALTEEGKTAQPISQERYDVLKEEYEDEISEAIVKAVYSTTDAYTIKSKTDKDKETCLTKYIESQARIGYTVTKEDLVFTDVDDVTHVDLKKVPQDILQAQVLNKAETLYAQKELYKIAGLEYLKAGTEDEEKNNYYLFKESSMKSAYERSYKTFGSYRAIIITFNSRREAMETMEELGGQAITKDNALESYLKLYNKYYSCYGEQTEDDVESSKLFNFTISLKKNDLDKFSSSVNTLITDTLTEENSFLTEPRNLDNKYVLAYRIMADYDYNEKDYDDLEGTVKEKLDQDIKVYISKANASSYIARAFYAAIQDSNLEIYDPLIEYRFKNVYTDYYDLINSQNPKIGGNVIFSMDGTDYTVEQFYETASTRLGGTIISEYFQNEYALKYYDDFMNSETNDTNKTTLDTAIKAFEKGENASYPKEIGLETFLLSSYGYSTKDAVMKYYYQAPTCLSGYKSKVLFDEWATSDHKISSEAEKVLNRILLVGNSKYDDIFTMNVDHILISIDYDADGTPDDPDKFISDNPELKESFEEEVSKLAKAIYKEATNPVYKDNSLYETLSYIVKQFNKGATLQDGTSWDDYKTKFNFLLRAEQLASSAEITQDSVSNFVVPFADYLKDMFHKANTEKPEIDDNGNFYTVQDGVLKNPTEESVAKITDKTLCKTVYGYHLIVLNKYDGANSLKYTSDSDPNDYQKNLEILISKNEDDDSKNVYVILDSYNSSTNEANLNQLFIYFVQQKTSASSSLDSNISTILSSLFTSAISQYSSSNFQTMVLLDVLNIKSGNAKLTSIIQTERSYYANQVINYDNESEFISWINPNTDWTRPNQK